MRFRFPNISAPWFWLTGGILVVVLIWGASDWWLPPLRAWLADPQNTAGPVAAHAGDDRTEGHDHQGHDEAESLELSPQARSSIGLRIGEVQPGEFSRTITIPAMIVARPGRTMTKIAAPLTGVVTAVYAVSGESVRSGDPLFRLRLTHEDLVQAQSDFLQTLGRLDVEEREIARLERITSGAVAGKVLLERQYEKEKLQAALNAQRESLLLHGLSPAQVDQIAAERKLLRDLVVFAPLIHSDSSLHHPAEASSGRPVAQASLPTTRENYEIQNFTVQQLLVGKGEAVTAGATLCVLADYAELYIEGRAFEQDVDELVRAANENRRATAISEENGSAVNPVTGLEIVYVANEVETESRALHFYVALPNEMTREDVRGGKRFVNWRFKLGQRMQVRVPVERWENVIVLPVDAIAQEGAESFVFVENGDHLDRRPVQVKYRDRYEVVLANDGSLFPGERVALNSAHQLQMALKNKSGAGADPHAGHNH